MVKRNVILKIIFVALDLFLVGFLLFVSFMQSGSDKSVILYWFGYPLIIFVNIAILLISRFLKSKFSNFVLNCTLVLLVAYVVLPIILMFLI